MTRIKINQPQTQSKSPQKPQKPVSRAFLAYLTLILWTSLAISILYLAHRLDKISERVENIEAAGLTKN